MAAQQTETRLEQYTTKERFVGERKRFNRFSRRAEMTAKEGRATPTKLRDQGTDLRWLDTELFDDGSVFDEWDEDFLADITSPKSGVIASMQAAAARAVDRKILSQIFGQPMVGKLGTDSGPVFDNTNRNVGIRFEYAADGYTAATNAADVGLTLDKIREAKAILGTADALMVDGKPEIPVIACRYRDMNALWGFMSKATLDFNLPDAFSQELLEKLVGVKFLQIEQFTQTSGEIHLPVWLPSGVKTHAAQWRSYMDVRVDLSHALQVRLTGRIGALRYDDDKVIRIRVKP